LGDIENELEMKCELEIPQPSKILADQAKEIKVIS